MGCLYCQRRRPNSQTWLFCILRAAGVKSTSVLSLATKRLSQTSLASLADDPCGATPHNGPTPSAASPYIPDFTLRATTDLQYLRIRRSHYLVARRATMVQRHACRSAQVRVF